MSGYYKEETLMEISKVAVNVTRYPRYPNTDDVLELCWVESMPPPYSDEEVDIEIDKEKGIELIEVLKSHFKIEDKESLLLDELTACDCMGEISKLLRQYGR